MYRNRNYYQKPKKQLIFMHVKNTKTRNCTNEIKKRTSSQTQHTQKIVRLQYLVRARATYTTKIMVEPTYTVYFISEMSSQQICVCIEYAPVFILLNGSRFGIFIQIYLLVFVWSVVVNWIAHAVKPNNIQNG